MLKLYAGWASKYKPHLKGQSSLDTVKPRKQEHTFPKNRLARFL